MTITKEKQNEIQQIWEVNFFYHNTVPTALKAPEERYYGNAKNTLYTKSAIGTTL